MTACRRCGAYPNKRCRNRLFRTDGGLNRARVRAGSAAIAFAARIDRSALRRRAARRTDARVAHDPNRRLEFFKKNRPGKEKTLRIADVGGGLQIGEFLQ